MRLEFTDAQKAEIYVRDRAVCAFSGKSLWILDYGVSPTFEIDWVDHVLPAARGGDNAIENGVCASYFYNSKKRANANDNIFLFFHGKPTAQFFYFNEFLAEEIAHHLARFAKAIPADWYFNRAIFRFMLGLHSIYMQNQGKTRKRDENYYAKSTITMLKKWHHLVGNSDSMETRGLLPVNPSPDQAALLAITQVEDPSKMVEHMKDCFSWYQSAHKAIDVLSQATRIRDLAALQSEFAVNSNLPERVKKMMEQNIERLSIIYAEPF